MATRRSGGSGATNHDMLLCRTVGHQWDPYDVNRHPDGGWVWQLRCERCTTIRYDVLEDDGQLYSRGYNYVDGYRDADIYESRADRRAALVREQAPSDGDTTALRVVGGRKKRAAS
jgi:hypothetical protein